MFWFLLNAAVMLLFLVLSARKYKTVLNPVSFIGGPYFLVAVASPIIYQYLDLLSLFSPQSITYTSILSSAYFACFASAVVVKASPFKFIFRGIFRWISPLNKRIIGGGIASCGLFAQTLTSFVLLMIASGAGLLWITNSRMAYQLHRGGVGVLWSFTIAALNMAFISIIFRQKKVLSLAVTTVGCAFLMSFLGSKGAITSLLIMATAYLNYCVRKISMRAIALMAVVVLALVFGLQIYQGTSSNFIGTLTYLDYFSDSAAVIDRFQSIGFYHGSLSISTLWGYVPRAIYPGKPFAYGTAILTNVLYPGSAESGNTPGLMPWMVSYADFGFLGVCLTGFFDGFFVKAAYELFLERKDIQSFLVFAQLGMGLSVFVEAPLPVFLLWLIVEMAFIQIASTIGYIFFSERKEGAPLDIRGDNISTAT